MSLFRRLRARSSNQAEAPPAEAGPNLTSDYTNLFFKRGQAGSERSAARVIPELIRLLSPTSVVDVGCGIGTWTKALLQNGVGDVLGVDGEHIAREALLMDPKHFKTADLFEPLHLERKFDLALSVEVAEHLPASRARSFVVDLTQMAPMVVFSAAIPGQGGTNHINEQWPDYWAQLFAECDYVAVDCLRPRFWNDGEIESWYRQNLILFVNRTHLENYPALKGVECLPQVLPLVHPEVYRRTEDAFNAIAGISDMGAESLATIAAVAGFTRNAPTRTFALCQAVRHIVQNGIAGDLVECGVWRGGGAMAIAKTLRESGNSQKNIYLYDTFGGMTPPTNKDVDYRDHHEMELMQRSDKLAGEAWSDSSLEDVRAVMETMGYDPTKIHYIKGRIEETIPQQAPENIALLRIDTNLYESTRHALQHLFPRLQPGGFLLVDGYGQWQGCRQAVDEYFQETKVPIFLNRIDFSARMGMVPSKS